MTNRFRGTNKTVSLCLVALAYVCAAAAAIGIALWAQGLHPLLVILFADLGATVIVFFFSVALGNSSVYDPYWSVAPIFIVVFLALAGGDPLGLRALVIMFLVTFWGSRLTWNWILRWRGLGDEDFRYQEIRSKTGRLYWPASFLAIHLFPTVTVYAACASLWAALSAEGRAPVGLVDLFAFAVTAGGILLETIADRQLRAFRSGNPRPGAFLETGLWARSRHPNYLGEVLFWFGLYLFGVAAHPASALWTAVGPVAMALLFLFVSVPWMDRRLVERRPGHAEYMQQVPALVPGFRR